MSLLAKVFIIIQALLVMAYLGVTSTLYQHRRDWRLSYQKLQERHAAMTKRATRGMSTLRTQIGTSEDGIKQKDTEIQQLKKDLDRTLNDFQTKNQALAAMTSKFNRMQETNNNLAASNDKRNQDIAAIDQRIQELTENLRRAEDKRRLAEQQVARFMTQKYTLLGDIGDMRKDYVTARKELRDKELLIAMAEERGVMLHSASAPAIEHKGQLAALLTKLEPNDVLFIDEIHRLPAVVEENLYTAVEDFRIDIVQGDGPYAQTLSLPLHPFTLVGATTRTGLLTNPMRSRFGYVARLDYYPPEELATIVTRSAKLPSSSGCVRRSVRS